MANYIVRTVDGLEHSLDGVRPLQLTSGAEYVFHDEQDRGIPFRCPIRSVTAIIDRSQYQTTQTKDDAAKETWINNQSVVSEQIRENVLKEAKQNADRYVVRPLETGKRKLQIFDTAEIEAGPVEIDWPELPKWPLKTPPKQYLSRHPHGKHSSLARALLVPLRAVVETLVAFANDNYRERLAEEDPSEPALVIKVTDIGDEPYATMPADAFNEMVANNELQPVLSPVWKKGQRYFRPEQRQDGSFVLRQCRMEFDGRAKPQQVNLNVPRGAITG